MALKFLSLALTVFSVLGSSFSEDIFLSIREVSDTIVHIPDGLIEGSGIVLALHGLGDNYPDNFQRAINLDQLSDETKEFAVVYPLGSTCIGSEGLCGHTWNGGSCCFSFSDDVSFLLEVIATTRQILSSVKRYRDSSSSEAPVFVVGFSAGGVMSHRIACQHPDIINAVVSVSGPLSFNECSPVRPISVMHVHGTLDPVFPWYGGAIGSSVPHTLNEWKAFNGCSEDDVIEEDLAFGISSKSWTKCSSEKIKVILVKEDGGLHSWPPERMNPEKYFWNFFKSSI